MCQREKKRIQFLYNLQIQRQISCSDKEHIISRGQRVGSVSEFVKTILSPLNYSGNKKNRHGSLMAVTNWCLPLKLRTLESIHGLWAPSRWIHSDRNDDGSDPSIQVLLMINTVVKVLLMQLSSEHTNRSCCRNLKWCGCESMIRTNATSSRLLCVCRCFHVWPGVGVVTNRIRPTRYAPS